MKKFILFLLALLVFSQSNEMFAQKDNIIRTHVPSRAKGQKDVLGLTVPAMKVVRVGFVGLGMRGPSAVDRWCHIPGTEIKALCDVEKERVENCQKILKNKGKAEAAEFYGSVDSYKKMCERKDIDLIYICTDWVHHVPIALYAMEHGKHVAIEVPAALTLKDIWSLIDMSEKTRKHCMMLENCVYDFFEMSALEMAKKGLFGEVIHTEGSYLHNLDEFWNEYWSNWRLQFNHDNRGDVYPTHGLGPACQVMGIHRTDRMDYLVAMDTDPFNGPKITERNTGKKCDDFKNGDQTTTVIRTAKGKTILIQHNVLTPRPYSRMYQIVGTDGYASKYPVEQLLFRTEALKDNNVKAQYDKLDAHSALPDSIRDAMLEKYTPEYVKEIRDMAKEIGGHGGMDYIMDYRLVYCLRNGLPLDMDVYDMAEWCCPAELTRISIENNSAPVEVPDFTRGAMDRTKTDK